MISLIKDTFEKSQFNYILSRNKEYLKNTSQFFTPYETACKMISTIDFNKFRDVDSLHILEPSAGCGILIASLILHIADNFSNIKRIHVDAYENDSDVSIILSKNLRYLSNCLKKDNKVNFEFKIIKDNFIIKNANKWHRKYRGKYDIIISNPPYKKINQSSKESIIMSNIIHGQPNIYMLFIAMSLKLLKPNGVYTVLSPRNYLVGEYSKKIREFIFSNYKLTHIHSFETRTMFKSVNQEVIISTYENSGTSENINFSFNGSSNFIIEYNDIRLDDKLNSIITPKNLSDIKLLKNFKSLDYSLEDLGLKISVGPVVQFRNKADIKKDIYTPDFAPLVISPDIQSNNKINYFKRENRRETHNKSIARNNKNLIKNSNYLILRKITAKDDVDLVISSVLHKDYFNHEFLGLDNNLLYIHRLDNTEINIEECYGLYVFINSRQFKEFYSLINGTHTINVNDFNNIKFPSLTVLSEMGSIIQNLNTFEETLCSDLVEKYVGIIRFH